LAQQLGIEDVDAMMARMSCRKLMEWMAFIQLQEGGKLQRQMEADAAGGARAISGYTR
jgi:hypothetical protein